MRRRFSFCAASSLKNSSLEVSRDDFREVTLYFRVKNLEVCLQFFFGACIGRLRFSKDFADSISAFQISASIGRLAPEDTSLLKLIARAGHFRNAAALRTRVYQLLFSWRRYLSPIVRAQPQEHSHFEVSLWDSQDMQY